MELANHCQGPTVTELDGCLRRSGMGKLREWGTVFKGPALVAVITHLHRVSRMRAHDREGRSSGRRSRVRAKYAI